MNLVDISGVFPPRPIYTREVWCSFYVFMFHISNLDHRPNLDKIQKYIFSFFLKVRYDFPKKNFRCLHTLTSSLFILSHPPPSSGILHPVSFRSNCGCGPYYSLKFKWYVLCTADGSDGENIAHYRWEGVPYLVYWSNKVEVVWIAPHSLCLQVHQ